MLREIRLPYPTTPQERAERARYLLDQVREGFTSAALAAKEFHDGDYWRDLGYPSWRACIKVELGRSTTQAYALLSEAKAQTEGDGISANRNLTYRAKQKARRARQSPAQSPTGTPTAVHPGDSAPLSLPTSPFPGLRRFLVEQDGRGWRLIVAFRDPNGATQLANTFHATFAHACATLAHRWMP